MIAKWVPSGWSATSLTVSDTPSIVIDPLGARFDPKLHEAIQRAPADEKNPELDDMSRRFWWGLAPTLALLAVAMGDMAAGMRLQHALGVRAAVVQAQQVPVAREQVQVFPDLGHRGEELPVRVLPLAVARVADGIALGEREHRRHANLGLASLSHRPQ